MLSAKHDYQHVKCLLLLLFNVHLIIDKRGMNVIESRSEESGEASGIISKGRSIKINRDTGK